MKRFNLLLTLSFLFLLVGMGKASAQIGSGVITLSPKDTLICPDQTIRLYGGFAVGATDVSADDQFGNQIINMGFPFNYYGNIYTQCLYGPNAFLSFDLANAGSGFTSWVYPTAQASGDINNAILMPFQDLVLTAFNGGRASCQTQGQAPFRKFILEICKVPQFLCGTQTVTSQVIIYETTNMIEIHIGEQPSCPGWNGGTQIEGLRGANGTLQDFAPGRGTPNSPWTATADGRRWTQIAPTVYKMDTIPYNPSVIIPNADSNDLVWYAEGNPVPVGYGAHIDVTPTDDIHYYYAQISGQNGCLGAMNYTFQDTVWINYGTSYDTTDVEICAGATYKWFGKDLFKAGNYDTLLSSALGCDSFLRLRLAVNPLPNVITKGSTNVEICDGSSTVISLAAPESGVTYQWFKDNNPIPGETAPQTTISQEGKYKVQATTTKGCQATSETFTLKVNPNPVANIQELSNEVICAYDTMEIKAVTGPSYDYRWSPEKPFRVVTGAEGQKVKGVFIDPSTLVTLTVYNQYGCYDTATAIVNTKACCEVFVPNAFSPNGDGLNEYFNPHLQLGQIMITMQIFDRYGKIVYNNTNIQKGWDGKYEDGAEASSGVYMYMMKYTCADGKVYEKKESVSLVR